MKLFLLLACSFLTTFAIAHCKPTSNSGSGASDDKNRAIKRQLLRGWSVQQNSKFYGKTQIFVSNQGVKLRRSRDDLVMVAVPPDWSVISYKPSSRKLCRISLAEFGYLIESFLKPIKLPALVVLPGSETTKWNTKTKTFWSGQVPYRVDATHKDVGPNRTFNVHLIAATDLNLPEQVGSFVSKYYGIPIVRGLPLQFTYSRNVEGSQLDLTTELLKPEEIDRSEFRTPSGYKEVEDIREVNLDSESSKFIDDFAKKLGE